MNKKDDIVKFVKDKEKEGEIVFQSLYGLVSVNLDDFVKQPAAGILYDLNRLPEVVLTFMDNPKWVNDYAVGLVITKLKSLLAKKGDKEVKVNEK